MPFRKLVRRTFILRARKHDLWLCLFLLHLQLIPRPLRRSRRARRRRDGRSPLALRALGRALCGRVNYLEPRNERNMWAIERRAERTLWTPERAHDVLREPAPVRLLRRPGCRPLRLRGGPPLRGCRGLRRGFGNGAGGGACGWWCWLWHGTRWQKVDMAVAVREREGAIGIARLVPPERFELAWQCNLWCCGRRRIGSPRQGVGNSSSTSMHRQGCMVGRLMHGSKRCIWLPNVATA